MITEQQRLQMLSILSLGTLINMGEIAKQMSEQLGREVTPEEVKKAIEQLKGVRGEL